MKPTKNRIYCKDCGRAKMLFETEKKAQTFIKFNREEIEAESGYGPQRSYFCLFCNGWHITSIKGEIGRSKNEERFEQYLEEKKSRKQIENKRAREKKKAKNNEPGEAISKPTNEEVRIQVAQDFENAIQDMDTEQKEGFFSENIDRLKDQIHSLKNLEGDSDRDKLKLSRQELEILYVIRKKHGCYRPKNKIDRLREQELELYRQWIEKSEAE